MLKSASLASACIIILTLHSICYAEVSLFGIKLGEPNVLKECKIKQTIQSTKIYDYSEKDCYTTSDIANYCETTILPDVSFGALLTLEFENPCDRTSKVIKIGAAIRSESFDQVLSLMINKFGKPKKTENSTVQNRMGASFKQTEVFWNVENCELYLSRYARTLNEGILVASHPIYLNKITNEYQNNTNKDVNKF